MFSQLIEPKNAGITCAKSFCFAFVLLFLTINILEIYNMSHSDFWIPFYILSEVVRGLGEYVVCKGDENYSDYFGGLFGSTLTDDVLCKVKTCGYQFYYMEKPTCVPLGSYADVCDTSTFACAGGSKYGYGSQQAAKAIAAIQKMNSGQAVDCPGEPPETCGIVLYFVLSPAMSQNFSRLICNLKSECFYAYFCDVED